ncbi:MAG TPA: TetR/AcrR family transcriptional regulator [Mycobacteriales bacterium]|nr:TetR/AcrR family transcriptional regulator [Mycobacteriales bacterium]
MAIDTSFGAATTLVDRRAVRRQQTIAEALTYALAIIAEGGVGALSISEVARRMGLRGPSLYKYFPSLNAVYDALFAYGVAAHKNAIDGAMAARPPGVERIRALMQASVRWSVSNPALAQLLFWRPVPGFEPSAEAFAASLETQKSLRAELAEATRRKQLSAAANTDEAVRLLTVVISGLFTQQVANQPNVGYDQGQFSQLTDAATEMLLARFQPRRRS